jgi:hypothetical protein
VTDLYVRSWPEASIWIPEAIVCKPERRDATNPRESFRSCMQISRWRVEGAAVPSLTSIATSLRLNDSSIEGVEGLRFEMLPVPTNADVLAILDRIMRRIARRLANDATSGELDEDAAPDVLAQVHAEAASTWRSPTDASASSARVATSGEESLYEQGS